MSFGVATLRAVVHAGDKTGGDASTIVQLFEILAQQLVVLLSVCHAALVILHDALRAFVVHNALRALAQLVDTESDPEEETSAVEELQSLGSRVPLMGEEFEAFKLICTRTDASHSSASSDSTTPLSPDYPLTHVLPNPTPTRALFHRKTARMTVHVQLAMSPSHSARVTKAMAFLDLASRKRYRSSYEIPSSSSSSLALLVRKRYRGTSELILDTDSEGDELGEEDTKEDESLDADDEREIVWEEVEVVPEGQQQGICVVEITASEPLGLSFGALRRLELAVGEDQPTLTTWVDLEDDRVYNDILIYPLVARVQTPLSPEWSSGSLPISPSSPVVPSPIASPVATPTATISVDEDQFLEVGAQLELHESIL
ncbi:hypothetical protein Tco_0779793 [Tanacetum coccineum]